MCYNDYSKEKELTTMKNNNYRRHNHGKYGYFPKKLLNKRVRKVGKKIEYEKDWVERASARFSS